MTRPATHVPVLSILRQRVEQRLHLGLLRSGERLPSVRVVSRELGVDPRVVLAGYRALEEEGFVELRARSGVFVAGADSLARHQGGSALLVGPHRSAWLVDRLAESLAAGIAAPMVLEQMRQLLEGRRLRAVVLDRNDDQLFSTGDELRRDYGFDTETIDLDTMRKAAALPHAIARADLIVTASPEPRIRQLARAASVPLLAVTMCPDLFAEVRQLLRTQQVYFVVSDPRFAAKLAGYLDAAAGKRRLRIKVYGDDDISVIPSSAPVYLTRLTRDRMERDVSGSIAPSADLETSGDLPAGLLLNRVMPDARVFSAESARELLEFMVRTNLAAPAPLARPAEKKRRA